MSQKMGEIIITAFIVLMLGGMLAGGEKNSGDVIVSENFESISIYDTDGYTEVDPFLKEENKLSKVNEKISVFISDLANDGLDFLFKLIKKVVS